MVGLQARVLAACLALGVLAGCGSDEPPRRLPSVPVTGVLDAAANPAFRAIDASSFRNAVVRYPAGGGQHRVPVGDYLATRIAQSFPANAEVQRLNLGRYDAACVEEGFLSSSVVCAVEADILFRIYRKPRRVQFSLRDVDLGDPETLEESGYRVAAGQETDAFSAQIRRLVDISAAKFREELQLVLVELNRQQAF